VRLRDFVDVSNGLKLVSTFADPAIVKAGFSEDMVKVNVVRARSEVYSFLRILLSVPTIAGHK